MGKMYHILSVPGRGKQRDAGTGIPQGVYMKEVDAGSPAMAAGIQRE